MKRIGLAIVLLLGLARGAFAACAGCTTLFAENWENYGTPSYVSGIQTIGPWSANVCGNSSCGTIGIVCATGLPWKATGTTGCYLHETPGGVTIPNNGTGTYLSFGNPHQRLLHTFWFRYTGSLSAGPNANFFYRVDTNDATPLGSDFLAPNLDGTGHIVPQFGGTTANAVAANVWHIHSWCEDPGTGSNGVSYWTVDGANWLSATGLAQPAHTASNNIALDNEFTGAAMDFGPVIISDPGASCTASTFYSGVYAYNIVPNSNGTVAWTPSAGANWSNVLVGSGNSNSSNTNGQQDLYNVSATGLGAIIAQGTLVQFQNDAAGDRVPLPVSTVSGTTTTGTVTDTLPPVGSYAATMVPITGAVAPTQIGVKVNN